MVSGSCHPGRSDSRAALAPCSASQPQAAAVDELWQAACGWLAEHGANAARLSLLPGWQLPLTIDAYDAVPTLFHTYNPPYYHGYVKNGGFEKLGNRLFIERERMLMVDPWALDVDFRSGVKRFFRALHDPGNAYRQTFIERFDRTYIEGEA